MSHDQERRAFCERFFGETEAVFHELAVVQPVIHVDLFRRTPQSSLLVTNGLSDHSMTPPEGQHLSHPRVELMLYVPRLKRKVYEVDVPWQVNLLRMIAHLAVDDRVAYYKYLVAPISKEGICVGSQLTTAFFRNPLFEEQTLEDGFSTPDGMRVDYLMVDFLTDAEVAYGMARGGSAVDDLLRERQSHPVLEPARPSYV